MLKLNHLGRRSAAVLAITALTVAAGGSAAQAKKKSHKYKAVCIGHLTGSSSSAGTCKGTLGTGKFKVSIAPPTSTSVVKYKGGTLTIVLHIVLKNNKVTGSWKIGKGTGKYKGAKGKGTAVSVLDPKTNQTTATSTGTITY